MQITTHTKRGVDKRTRYGWIVQDKPGELRMLHKDVLRIDPTYQRELLPNKVKEITASWSWAALGALVVAHRDGDYWVVDGQHRAMAAKRRSDIAQLPCVVFQTNDSVEEARAFLTIQTCRKPVTALAKQKALVVSGDAIAMHVQSQLEALGLSASKTGGATGGVGAIKCLGWCNKRAAENKDAFDRVLRLGAELSSACGIGVAERLLDGLWFLHFKCGDGLDDPRLEKRIRERGAAVLLDGANRAAAYYRTGGNKVWAEGMLTEINKGLHKKFTMGDDPS